MTAQEHALTVEDCKEKHRPLTLSITLLYVFLSVIIVLVGWDMLASNSASKNAYVVAQDLKVHEAHQIATTVALNQTLIRLENQIKEQRIETKEQRLLFGQLLREYHAGGVHSPDLP